MRRRTVGQDVIEFAGLIAFVVILGLTIVWIGERVPW